jgi:proline iminopeptidase
MYPSIQPYKKIKMDVDTLSSKKISIYIELSGNPKGYPVIYLHGGPGDSINPRVRRLYNPKKYNIIMFDQRGCGKSTPTNHLEKNTTQHLISDMEKIREWVGCDQWIVSGGSWGSTLALLYAQQYPEHTSGLILRGLYDLADDNCVQDAVFPDKQEEMNKLLKTTNESAQLRKISSLLSSKNKTKNKTRKRLINLMGENNGVSIFSREKNDSFKTKETMAIVCNHYELNKYFVPKNEIYKKMHKIKHIKTYIVDGRYDLITPMKMAFKINKLFEDSKLIVVKGGHTVMEPEISEALTHASDDMGKFLRI